MLVCHSDATPVEVRRSQSHCLCLIKGKIKQQTNVNDEFCWIKLENAVLQKKKWGSTLNNVWVVWGSLGKHMKESSVLIRMSSGRLAVSVINTCWHPQAFLTIEGCLCSWPLRPSQLINTPSSPVRNIQTPFAPSRVTCGYCPVVIVAGHASPYAFAFHSLAHEREPSQNWSACQSCLVCSPKAVSCRAAGAAGLGPSYRYCRVEHIS